MTLWVTDAYNLHTGTYNLESNFATFFVRSHPHILHPKRRIIKYKGKNGYPVHVISVIPHENKLLPGRVHMTQP